MTPRPANPLIERFVQTECLQIDYNALPNITILQSWIEADHHSRETKDRNPRAVRSLVECLRLLPSKKNLPSSRRSDGNLLALPFLEVPSALPTLCSDFSAAIRGGRASILVENNPNIDLHA